MRKLSYLFQKLFFTDWLNLQVRNFERIFEDLNLPHFSPFGVDHGSIVSFVVCQQFQIYLQVLTFLESHLAEQTLLDRVDGEAENLEHSRI